MKLTVFFLTAAILNVSAKSVSQNVTFSGKNVSLEKVLAAVKQQTGYLFLYQENALSGAKPITIQVKDKPLIQFLNAIFNNQPLKYSISSKTINIYPSVNNTGFNTNTLPLSGLLIDNPPVPMTGRILDSLGNPLSGATITIRKPQDSDAKGKNISTTTSSDGSFSITVNEGDVLLVSYVGYETRSVIIIASMLSSTNNLVITLRPSITKLEEVEVMVSTGYQDIPKERATGSFVKVDNELLNRRVNTNILDKIYGVTSGLNFEPKNANSNRYKSSITIRGISTINANPRPLLVVDGFPYKELGSDFINYLNPNDVESITILKDAAASSIWGVDAGNGVIVIKTKKGRFNQKSNIQFNSNLTIAEKPDLFYLPVIKASDEVDFEKKRFNNGNYNVYDDVYAGLRYFSIPLPEVAELLLAVRKGHITQAEADEKMELLKQHDVRNDVKKHVLQRNVNQQYSLNISGGNDKYNYYASVGYDDNKSYIIGIDNKRMTLRFDNTVRPLKGLEINSYIYNTQIRNSANGLDPQSFLALGVSQAASYASLIDSNGNHLAIASNLRLPFVDTAKYAGLLDWHYRPLDEIKYSDNKTKRFDTRIGASLSYNIIKGLNVELKYQYQKLFSNSRSYRSQLTFFTRNLINRYMIPGQTASTYPIPLGGILDQSYNESKSWNFRSQINYNRIWNKNQLTLLAGLETRESYTDLSSGTKYGYEPSVNTFNTTMNYSTSYSLNPDRLFISRIPNGERFSGTLDRYFSYYGNGAYIFSNKYVLSISGRIDASNFFGVKANQKYVPLWSAGFAWDIFKEKFYNISWLPYLKLRATYGYNGNTDKSATAHPTMAYVNPSSFSVLPIPYGVIATPPNPELRWEKVRIINIGVDFETNDKRIGGTIEYFTKRGIDLISSLPVEATRGITSFRTNTASIKGKGIDIMLNTRNIDNNFKWNTIFLFNYVTDKVTSYSEMPLISNLVAGSISPFIGKPLWGVHSYRWAGLDPANGNPRSFLDDTITNFNLVLANVKLSDLTYSGPSNPQFFGSVRNTFLYNNISVSFNIVYKFNYYFRRNSINYSNLFTNWGGHSDYALRWQKPGDEVNTNVPSAPAAPNFSRDAVYLFSDATVEKGDHIRLQDIRVSYDFNKRLFKRMPFYSTQVYVYVDNLGILWRANKHNIDPDYGDYLLPAQRMVSIGLNIGF